LNGCSSGKLRSVSIGGLTKAIKEPNNPELVPTKYLPEDDEIPKETLRVRAKNVCSLTFPKVPE
jgi:hypothetical protein